MDLYRGEILDHYQHPHNWGELIEATAAYEEYNPLCGDRIELQLRVERGEVKEVKFRGEGCAIATASASMMTDYFRGRKVDELKELKGEDVLKIVGLPEISPGRLKCALLVLEALRGALSRITN